VKMRKLNLRKRARSRQYSDARMAYELSLLEQEGNMTRLGARLDIPRGTISARANRYLQDDEFAERIDAMVREEQKR